MVCFLFIRYYEKDERGGVVFYGRNEKIMAR
jgi:hypothetical protein